MALTSDTLKQTTALLDGVGFPYTFPNDLLFFFVFFLSHCSFYSHLYGHIKFIHTPKYSTWRMFSEERNKRAAVQVNPIIILTQAGVEYTNKYERNVLYNIKCSNNQQDVYGMKLSRYYKRHPEALIPSKYQWVILFSYYYYFSLTSSCLLCSVDRRLFC